MLSALDEGEQKTLADLLAEIVRAGDHWPDTLTDPERDLADPLNTEHAETKA